jgi:hypothetical protein
VRITAAVGWVLILVFLATGTALAQSDARPGSRKARGIFVEYDPGAETVAVREHGKLRLYALLADGDRGETVVSIQSESARVSELEAGAPVIVSWHPDAENRERRVATRIEAPTIPKSFREDLR